ncbi:hypothetical protein Tco_0367158 [Tanacetum coccineum]
MFIKSRFYLDDEYVDMTRNKFLQYTRLDIPEFRDTLIQHMESVKKSIGERAQHKMEYESRVNERQIQTTEEKTDTSNALDALDASSVIIKSNRTESKEQDTSSRLGNDAHVDDADIRPIYDEEPMAEVQMTADDNVSATGQQHTEQPEFINEGEVDQNAEQCHDICPFPDDKTTKLSNQSLESENVCLKKTVAQCQKDFAKLEAHCINLELQMQNNVLKSGQQSRFLKEKSNEAKYIVLILRGMTQSLAAKERYLTKNKASRNFDLMNLKRRLNTAVQASIINVYMTFEQSSSSLGRQCQMVSAKNNTSGPVLIVQKSDRSRSSLSLHGNDV